MKDLLNPGQTEAEKEFPSLSRREGVVPDEVWHWIVAAKADVVLNPKSAHALLRVSNDGKSLYQSSPSSPPRVLMAETYLKCICVSSKVLPSTRVYLELRVTRSVPWTVGFRTASFDADNNYDCSPAAGIWTIASVDGKILINAGKAIPTDYTTPARLGLYLDYRLGQLSFYDAVAKLHLFTYVANFKEQLLIYASVETGIELVPDAFITLI
ncbi:butyrophilin-like protein 9 [Pygocentrus nattereri]|uniref:butyrophilin-like protein 9 n=1 Tax=Pygocentrus nattereri TaxID=42514 RepID=UPI00081475C6|nr:butyrophilin-like protein 9 [Pygocentrus nattereri]